MTRHHIAPLLAFILGGSLLLVSCTTAPPEASAPPAPPATGQATPTGTPRVVTTGLQAPWSIVFFDGTPLISERDSGLIFAGLGGAIVGGIFYGIRRLVTREKRLR